MGAIAAPEAAGVGDRARHALARAEGMDLHLIAQEDAIPTAEYLNVGPIDTEKGGVLPAHEPGCLLDTKCSSPHCSVSVCKMYKCVLVKKQPGANEHGVMCFKTEQSNISLPK